MNDIQIKIMMLEITDRMIKEGIIDEDIKDEFMRLLEIELRMKGENQ